MNRLLLLLLAVVLLTGCNQFFPDQQDEVTPYCVVGYSDPFGTGVGRVVMCQCMPGASIPAECGGGIAPTTAAP